MQLTNSFGSTITFHLMIVEKIPLGGLQNHVFTTITRATFASTANVVFSICVHLVMEAIHLNGVTLTIDFVFAIRLFSMSRR